MDTDARDTSPALPRTAPFEPATTGQVRAYEASPVAATVAVADSRDHAGVFGHLVHDDADIAGLVAYSIYKQNKLDWLRAFEAAKGRAPETSELESYIIGEGTPRRLATYRHLAEATLAGHGPEVGQSHAGTAFPSTRRSFLSGRQSWATGLVAIYALIAVLFVLGFWLAMHFTVASR